MPNLKLILASASPRRKELLGHLGIPFEILAMNIDESSAHTEPKEFCRDIALQKGAATLAEVKRRPGDFFVVSADTIVCLDQRIYGKPVDRDEARKFLTDLSGKTHSVFTAVALKLWKRGVLHETSFVDESLVSFSTITPVLMENYLDTGDSLDKAGAYGIQGPSLTFISNVDGSYSNVVGFPLSRFVSETEKFLMHHYPEEASWFKLFF